MKPAMAIDGRMANYFSALLQFFGTNVKILGNPNPTVAGAVCQSSADVFPQEHSFAATVAEEEPYPGP